MWRETANKAVNSDPFSDLTTVSKANRQNLVFMSFGTANWRVISNVFDTVLFFENQLPRSHLPCSIYLKS